MTSSYLPLPPRNSTWSLCFNTGLCCVCSAVQVFVWIGDEASEEEKEQSMTIAQQYIDNAMDGRDPETPIIRVAAGQEPLLFTCNFQGWSREVATTFQVCGASQASTSSRRFHASCSSVGVPTLSLQDPYEAKLAKLREEKAFREAQQDAEDAPHAVTTAEAAATTEEVDTIPAAVGEYTLEQLRNAVTMGLDVDPTRKEQYLTESMFEDMFGMTKVR